MNKDTARLVELLLPVLRYAYEEYAEEKVDEFIEKAKDKVKAALGMKTIEKHFSLDGLRENFINDDICQPLEEGCVTDKGKLDPNCDGE